MNILGIETSCDETAASVVKDGRDVLSNIVTSSLTDHQPFGGVIPEIASRRQLELIDAVIRTSLKKARLDLKDISKVAVTRSPGLIGSLLVGVSYARALGFTLAKPLLEVDHIQAHLYANFLNEPSRPKNKKLSSRRPSLPAVGLIVSGGHTSLYYIHDFQKFRLLGETRDDAAGEAFDKVAKILRLGYPGGPVIDRLAPQGQKTNLRFSCAELPDSFDFSFSGIKTAVLYHCQKNPSALTAAGIAEIAYAFQESVVGVLVRKSFRACEKMKTRTLLIGGGVAANSRLRSVVLQEARQRGVDVFLPPLNLCMDNAAMIAGLAYHAPKKNKYFFQRRGSHGKQRL